MLEWIAKCLKVKTTVYIKNIRPYMIHHQLPTRALWTDYTLLPSSREVTAVYSKAQQEGSRARHNSFQS